MTNNVEQLKSLKKVKGFDIDSYDGTKSKIGSVELSEIKNLDFGRGLTSTRQLIIKSENITESESNPILVTEYIPLKFDEETKEFGIPENVNSKAMKFLAYFKVNSFDEVIGKECMIVKRVTDKGNFLGIHMGA